jgi:F-type H+-transporting ATPase subunit delta
MNRTANNWADALYDLTANKSDKDIVAMAKRFVALLASRGLLKLGDKIAGAFEARCREEDGTVTIRLTSASEPSKAALTELKSKLAQALDAPVEIESASDPSLIGGAVIRYGDVLLDASIKRKLVRIKEQLTS